MREYKFRYRFKNHIGETCSLVLSMEQIEGSKDFYTSLRQSLGFEWELQGRDEWTGLRDSKRTKEYPNGQEIYEGDIIQFPDPCTRSQSGYELSTGVIEWHADEAKFDVTGRESVDLETFWEDIDMAEVIGNIHEHPHLLEEAKSQ
ncbi:YopX family protein [Paenibacillus oleatilyticus]|uniref:YopX family protein n=1 Tax=Paenibacillus oleatilyticus TaxID=2594886 RepID=UPI001C1F929A|nr:YopX family protein [Paenibacillus oleatilyticus]MBU7320299.1 YopX family protein [Paenibacillus oleatilyticus]